MNKILMADDEILIRELVAKYAKLEQIEVEFADNGQDAINLSKENSYDLIIMDIMMPVLDGFSAVKEIRKFSNVPIILLSARSEEYDKIYGFDLGVDDYVTKPFSPKELMMRVKAIINRIRIQEEKAKKVSDEFIYKTLKIDFSAHSVFINDNMIELTHKEYELLVLLIKNEGKALTRECLLETIWGMDFDGDDRTLDTHIKSLRKKILEYADNIITIRRVGYRFEVR